MFIDTHAHIFDEVFKGHTDEVVSHSQELNIGKIITSAVDYASSVYAVKNTEKYPDVYVSIGVYPEYIYDYNDEIENDLYELALNNKKVVAIGEIGLQFTDGMPDRQKQEEIFVRQLYLANKLDLPIVIHCRDAYSDLVRILKEHKDLKTRGTVHCFTGSLEIAKELLKLGFYISVGGVSTFKNAVNVQRAIKEVPIEKIVLETDSPYLTPHPYRGKVNFPGYVNEIAQNLANLKGLSIEDVERITTQNARRLFNV